MLYCCVCVSPVLKLLSSCQGACFGKLANVEDGRSHEQGSVHQRVRIHFMQVEGVGGGGSWLTEGSTVAYINIHPL